jgi:Spy/CpxP family protein refolding chaperone
MNGGLKWKIAIAFLLVFVAGGVTGAFFGFHHLRHHIILGPPHSGDVGDRMREHFRRALDLTSEQETKIKPIIDATSAKLEAIRVETAERVRAAMEESKKEVAPFLSPEQQKKLDKLESEHRKMMLHHGFDPPPPPSDKQPPPP